MNMQHILVALPLSTLVIGLVAGVYLERADRRDRETNPRRILADEAARRAKIRRRDHRHTRSHWHRLP